MTREEEIFGQAMELPAGERAAFLARACGDDRTLHDRVAELIAACDASGDFLEGNLSARVLPTQEEKPGDVIGRYTLIEKIGEGGCGVVYLAEQTEPVRRRVALKVIKLGMDTRQVILRFEAERQALALMDHADIARVYDAGATAAGRPYFVMEYVDGVPITKFCDAQQLPMAARLELFARVCLALQHAHQKGIVHRDVKPSNILVTLQDGGPAPKVIDFGIAKATQGRLTEATLATGFDQFLGTPSYMSPEQAELRDLDIDTRSDVYSLGVLLYELLTGRPPFDPKSLVRAGIEEIRRIIREVDPPRPSTVVSTLGHADRATVAQLRGAAPARLTSTLQGDLDWIVMRCLEKDRGRRYSTAHELADDVRRHLRSEPVLARPPQLVYVARKFVARHRLACASAAALAASLILGTVISVRQAIRATRAETVAQGARTDAQRRQEQAEDVLSFMLGDFRDDLKKVGQLDLLAKIGVKAQAYFDHADPRDLTDTALLRQAKALSQIGEVRLLQKDVRFAEAESVFVSAHRRASELVARHPQDGDMLFERAQAEFWIGNTNFKRGDFEAAGLWLGRYRDSAVSLVALDPANLKWQRELISGHHNLAALDVQRGQLVAARTGFLAEAETVRRLLVNDPTNIDLRYKLTDIESYLGGIAARRGDFAEGLTRFASQRAELEALLRAESDSAQFTLKLAECTIMESEVLAVTGRKDEANERLARARLLLAPLLLRDPTNRRWLALQATVLAHEAELMAPVDPVHALTTLLEARRMAERLLAGEPTDRTALLKLMVDLRLEATIRLESKQTEATALATRAVEVGDTLLREARVNDRIVGEMSLSCVIGGRAAAAAGRTAESTVLLNRGLELVRPRLADSRDWWLLDPAARALLLLGRAPEAGVVMLQLQQLGYVPLDPWPQAAAVSRR